MWKLAPDLLTADDRATLRRVGELLGDRHAAIAEEWARRFVAAWAEFRALRPLITSLNDRILRLVLERCRDGDFERLYGDYYAHTYELVEADLQIGHLSDGSLHTMHSSARIALAVIGAEPGVTPEMMAAYMKLELDLMMLADQAHADCHRAFFERAQELAVAGGKRKEEFLAVLAHELRSPLGAIRNAVALLQRDSSAPNQTRLATSIIDRQAGQVTRLVDDLYDLSRITHGRLEFRRERVDLETIVTTAVEPLRPQIEARRQRLDIALPEPAVQLFADPIRLVQILANLLGNAVKYAGEGGEIALRATCAGDEVRIEVRDTGAGIDAAVLPHVFDPFVRVSSHPPQEGLGIGLMLVRALVAMHDGSVTASSGGPGKGSEFVVRLPLGAR
jgi:signal transduction histidine kinase